MSIQKHYHLWRIKTCGGCDVDICEGIYAERDNAAHKYRSNVSLQARREGIPMDKFFTRACDCRAGGGRGAGRPLNPDAQLLLGV